MTIGGAESCHGSAPNATVDRSCLPEGPTSRNFPRFSADRASEANLNHVRAHLGRGIGPWHAPLALVGLWSTFWIASWVYDLWVIWVRPDQANMSLQHPVLLTIQISLTPASACLVALRPAWSAALAWGAMTLAPVTGLYTIAIFGLPLVTVVLIVWSRGRWLSAHVGITAAWLIIGTIRDTSGLFFWTTALLQLVAVAIGLLLRKVRAARDRDTAAKELAEQTLRDEIDRRERLLHQLATELHDAVASELTMISLDTSTVAASDDPAALRAVVASAGEGARAAQAELRALLGVLRQSGLSTDDPTPDADPPVVGRSLPHEIGRLAEVLRNHGFVVDEQVSLQAVPSGTALASVHITAQRILQEAVANVIRHAPPGTDCRMEVHQDADALRVVVSSLGNPENVAHPSTAPDAGTGLRSLAERVELLSGQLSAGPRDGRWEVVATLPVGLPTEPARRLSGTPGVEPQRNNSVSTRRRSTNPS